MQFNIPRVSVDRTEELTEYEFEYELILRNEYHLYLKDMRQNDPVDMDQGNIDREFRADPEVYESLKKQIESGEPLNIKLPDTSHIPRMSEIMARRQNGAPQEQETPNFEPLRPEDVFSRVLNPESRR